MPPLSLQPPPSRSQRGCKDAAERSSDAASAWSSQPDLERHPIRWNHLNFVMAGLDPAISWKTANDPRVKPGDDDWVIGSERIAL
jgi:hypothetical protein